MNSKQTVWTVPSLIRSYLDEQYATLVTSFAPAGSGPAAAGLVAPGPGGASRRGTSDAIVIHRTRVAARRYRSVLRVFARVLDESRARHLDAELAWYAGLLGAIRDLQVLRPELLHRVANLPACAVPGSATEGAAVEAARAAEVRAMRARVEAALDRDDAAARTALQAARYGPRFAALVEELAAWHRALPLAEGADAVDVEAVLRRVECTARRRLAKAERSLHTAHGARKAAKRARYTAELAAPALGRRSARMIRRFTGIQDRLGAQQDGVVAAEFLRRLALELDPAAGESGFSYGVLWALERARC